MYRSILVPLDGSSFGERALPLAAGIAWKANAQLRLLHVHTAEGEVELPTLTPYQFEGLNARFTEERASREEGDYLADVARRLCEKAPLSLATAILGGTLAVALERYIRDSDGDLLVMTTHARGALGRLWLGSVGDTLVRRAGKPVVLIHAADDGLEAHLDEEPAVGRMLVALDGSPLAEQVLEPACDLARVLGSRLELFTVVTPAMVAAGAFGRLAAGGTAAVDAAQAYLEAVHARLGADVEAEVQVSAGGDPAAAILNAAEMRGAGLIALATHGRGGLSRLVAGSVAEKVVHATRTPVLLVRPVH
jgi:nucleotide-binding universal stress UspA family protein